MTSMIVVAFVPGTPANPYRVALAFGVAALAAFYWFAGPTVVRTVAGLLGAEPAPALLQAASFSGIALASLLAGSGLDFLRGMIEGRHPGPPFADAMDLDLVEVEEGRVVFTGRPSARFFNPLGTVHGGWTATILDSAMACATHATEHLCFPRVDMHEHTVASATCGSDTAGVRDGQCCSHRYAEQTCDHPAPAAKLMAAPSGSVDGDAASGNGLNVLLASLRAAHEGFFPTLMSNEL